MSLTSPQLHENSKFLSIQVVYFRKNFKVVNYQKTCERFVGDKEDLV